MIEFDWTGRDAELSALPTATPQPFSSPLPPAKQAAGSGLLLRRVFFLELFFGQGGGGNVASTPPPVVSDLVALEAYC